MRQFEDEETRLKDIKTLFWEPGAAAASECSRHLKSNQIKSNHFYCQIVSEILESVLQTVQKQFTFRQYVLTDLYRRQCAI